MTLTDSVWRSVELREVATIQSGGTPLRTRPEFWAAGHIPWVTTSEVNGSVITSTGQHITGAGLRGSSAKLFPAETVLIAMYGQGRTRGQTAILGIEAATNQACAALVSGDQADPWFLFQYLAHSYSALRALSNSAGQDNLSAAIISRFRLLLPPLAEQRKIAEILRTWDDAIEQLRVTATLRRQHYQALASRLTSQSGESTRVTQTLTRLSEATREITRRNGNLELGRGMVMGVSNRVGLFPMRQQTIAADISRYKVLPRKGFAYNPMRINVGSIAMSNESTDVLVSPDYILFECNSELLLPEYLRHLMNTEWWSYHMTASGSGSVRSRIYFDDLAALHLALPSVQSQTKICELLDAAQQLVSLRTEEAELIETQKRGLMQKLLTGEIRVSGDGAASSEEAAHV